MISASKRIDYAIMLMASLPDYGAKHYRSLQDVAAERKLSAGFLGQVMMPLKKASLVIAKEGASGGYQLSKPSEDISLSEVVEAIEGPLRLTNCQNVDRRCVCEQTCPTKGLWSDLQSLMNTYLQRRSVADFRKSSHRP